MLDIKPTIAYKFHERFSVGFGLDIFTFASFLGEGRSVQYSVAAGNIPGTFPGQELELNGTGTAVGANASLLWTPWMTANGKPRMNVGFVWRSQAKLPLNGSLRANGEKLTETKTSLNFPDSYEWGIAAWPIRAEQYEWKIEVDVDYVRWSSIKNFDISFSDGTIISNPQDWRDAVTIGVGTEWKWMKHTILPNWDYTVRAGYLRSHSPVPNQNFNPAFPDSNLNSVTAGLGVGCYGNAKFMWLLPCNNSLTKVMNVDLAYIVLLWEPRIVTNHPNPGVNGKYETITHTGSVTFRIRF